MSTPTSRPLRVSETHQHIDDHAVLHSDSLHKEFSGPILRLIPEDIQVFIVVPFGRQQFWFLITGTWLRRHQGWGGRSGLQRQSYKRPYKQVNPISHFTDEGMEIWRKKISKTLYQVRSLGPRSLDSCSWSSLTSDCLCGTAVTPVKNLLPWFNNNFLIIPWPRVRQIISRATCEIPRWCFSKFETWAIINIINKVLMKNTDSNALLPPDYYSGLTEIMNFHTKCSICTR